MKKFWNWIKNSDDTRILRLEGPIDEESFWGDEITPQMFRDELNAGEGDVTVWINSPGGNVFAELAQLMGVMNVVAAQVALFVKLAIVALQRA